MTPALVGVVMVAVGGLLGYALGRIHGYIAGDARYTQATPAEIVEAARVVAASRRLRSAS